MSSTGLNLKGIKVQTARMVEIYALLQKEIAKTKSKIEISSTVGKVLAERAINNKVNKVVFDRNGYPYHGRVKAVAEAAREAGLKF